MTLLANCLISVAFALPQAPATTPAVVSAAPQALQRVVVLGASLSDGYGLDAAVGAKTSFADVVDASILADHGRVSAVTSLLFFTDPDAIGGKLIEKVRSADPTLVVALDYLFWYAYGAQPSDEARLAHLDTGLAALATLDCPILLGDIPDMGEASRPGPPGSAPPLLGPEQVPSGEALAALNARIRAWASERQGVVVVPLADLIAKLHAGVEIRIRGNHWAADARAKLIGPDRLHPTLEGAAALWVASLDALAAARTELPVSTFDWSAAAVVQRVVDGKARVREDNRRRAEERAKRAEKRQRGGDPAGG